MKKQDKNFGCKQHAYVYPDINDALTIQMIDEVEKKTGMNWGDDEKIVLNNLKNIIQKNIKKDGSCLIDFGCGEGRLLTEFEEYFEKVIAVEPDEKRFNKAIKYATDSHIIDKTSFINDSIENAEINVPADVAIVSHIVQHVHPDTVTVIIKKASSSLKSGGLLYLAANNMNGSRDKYTKSYSVGGKLKEARINREEFISLVNNDRGILPIHWFSQKKLTKILTDNGLTILSINTFHGSKNNPDRDIAIIALKNKE